ncbi:MAG: hypothetical protein IPJ19_20480 [Planctomycetes bacterium]|nr:hypothetical protein [Planctomycetota bacterium]
MSHERDKPDTPNPALPRVEERLRALGGRLSRLLWMHGLSTVFGAAALWMLVTFALDWWLHVPLGVRWMHLLALIGVCGFLFWRGVVRPLRARPDRSGLAVLFERSRPELRQLLVSAVELADEPADEAQRSARRAIWSEAEALAPTLVPARALDARGPRRRVYLGAAAVGCLGLVFAWQPEAASIYLERLFGGSTPWPQRTHLALEVPSADPAHPEALVREDGELHVRLPKGADLPIIVHAHGAVPEEVTLHLSNGSEIVVSSSGGDSFRTFVRALTEDFSLTARGGDDDDEEPRLFVQVLEPPDVLGIAVRVEPPAYSGLPVQEGFEPEVEVLAGSKVSVALLPKPADARGSVQLLPEDRSLELAPVPYPAANPGEKSTQMGLGFELTADKSLRYRLRLLDANGLSNPEPGLYSITVVADRPPEVELLSPSRGDVDTVPGGWIALRVRIEDDFGISRVWWSANPAGGDEAAAPEHEIVWRALAPEELHGEPQKNARVRVHGFARARLTVPDLAGSGDVVEGAQFRLGLFAQDDCHPAPHQGRSFPIQVRVVSLDEFLRRVQDRLGRAQLSTRSLTELARDKLHATQELATLLASDAPELKDGAREIAALSTGLRRVQGDARSLGRELVALVEAVLYARLDERSQGALEEIDKSLSESTARGFDPAPWRELAGRRRRGEISADTLAAKLVEVAGLSLDVSEDDSREASAACAQAQESDSLEKMHAALARAVDSQSAAVAKLERLSELLSEWDNFQSVLNLTRDILSGQKNLNERTSKYAKEH